eukprot:tig00020801_g13919.t1
MAPSVPDKAFAPVDAAAASTEKDVGARESEGADAAQQAKSKGRDVDVAAPAAVDINLDNAGAPTPCGRALADWLSELQNRAYGNPHTQSPSGRAAADLVASARSLALRFFGADEDEYACVLTSGATAALRTLGEAFCWREGSEFVCTREAHNSMLGIRAKALAAGATFSSIPYAEAAAAAASSSSTGTAPGEPRPGSSRPPCLFGFPGECNFDGSLFDPALAAAARRGLFTTADGPVYVLLDAARLAATSPLELSRLPAEQRPDFVAISFYKIFGFPTGLGALLVKQGSERALRKTYFGGGSVLGSAAEVPWEAPRPGVEALLEDGTPPFQLASALVHGIEAVERQGGMASIGGKARRLAAWTARQAESLRHPDGSPLCEIYLQRNAKRGASVALNVRTASGAWVPPAEVARTAALVGICIRAGGLCNPGACLTHLGVDASAVRAAVEAGRGCGSGDPDFEWSGGLLGGARSPAGAVRVSFGARSEPAHAQAFIDFLSRFFLASYLPAGVGKAAALGAGVARQAFIQSLYLYPVKGCGGTLVRQWPLHSTGLMYDRSWAIVDTAGRALGPKRLPAMARIRASVDLAQRALRLRFGDSSISVPLSAGLQASRHDVTVCGAKRVVHSYGQEVNRWLSLALGTPSRLVRVSSTCAPRRSAEGLASVLEGPETHPPLCLTRRPRPAVSSCGAASSFANEAPLLAISTESLQELSSRLGPQSPPLDRLAARFRPNLVVSGTGTYIYARDG